MDSITNHSNSDRDNSHLMSNDTYYSPIDWTVGHNNNIPNGVDNSHHSLSRSSSSRSSRSTSESSFNSSLGLGDSHADKLHSSATEMETDLESDVHSDDIDKDYEKLEQLRRSVRKNLQLRPLRVSSLQGNSVDTLTPRSAAQLDSAVSDDTFYDFGQSPTSSTNTRCNSAFSDYDNDNDVYYTPTTEIGSAPPSARWIGSGSADANGFGFKNSFHPKRSDSPVGGAKISSPIATSSSHALYPSGLSPSTLLSHLPSPISHGTRPLLIDTRPLQSFLQSRIHGSVNVAVPSLIMRRFQNRMRKPSKPTSAGIGGVKPNGFASLNAVRMYVTTESGRAVWDALLGSEGSEGQINSGWNGDIVVYDEDMSECDIWKDRDKSDSVPPIQNFNQNQSPAWSLIPLLSPLVIGNVYYLRGGFSAFRGLAGKDSDADVWVVVGDEESQLNENGLGFSWGPSTGLNRDANGFGTRAIDPSENRFASSSLASKSAYSTTGIPVTVVSSSSSSSTVTGNANSNFNSTSSLVGSTYGPGQTQTYTPSPRKGGLFHLDVQNPPKTRIIPESDQTSSSASSSSTNTPSSSSPSVQLSQLESQYLSSPPLLQAQIRSYSLSPPSTYRTPSDMTSSPPPLTLQIHSDTPSPSPSAIMFTQRDNRPRKASVPNLRRLDTTSMERLGAGSALPKLSLKTSIGMPHRASTYSQPHSSLEEEGNGGSILERLGPLSPMRSKTDFPSLRPLPPSLNINGSSLSRKFLTPNIHLNGSSDCLPPTPISPITPTTFSQHRNTYTSHPPTPRADSATFTFPNNNDYSNSSSSSPSPSPSPFQDPPTTDSENPMPAFSISTILPNFLFLGPELSAPEHVDELKTLGVKRILNIAIECDDDLGLNLKEQFERYEKIPMRDTVEEENVEKSVRLACEMLDDARLHSASTYVHCKAGKSRSVTAVIAYLIHANHWNLSQAYQFVVERRKGVSPNIGFVSELMNFEEQELGTKSLGVRLGAASGSSPGLSNMGCGDDSGKGSGMKSGSGKSARRGHHARESLPPTFQPQLMMAEIFYSADASGDGSGLGNPVPGSDMIVDSSHELEVRDASGRYRHLRRAPVDEATLQPSRRMSKAGLESAFSMESSSISTDD